MPNTLNLEIVTPDARACSEDVEMVTLPASEGEIGVYPQHIPLLSQMVCGSLVIRKEGRDYYYAVGDGFVEITGERVSVMTDMAIRSEDIDEVKTEEARGRAEARLLGHLGDEELALVNSTLAHALAKLKVKRGHRGG
jgi:F-type H+-transporting ATPase subunit epsilon